MILLLAASHVHFWGELISGGTNPSQPQCQHSSLISHGRQEPSCHSQGRGMPILVGQPTPTRARQEFMRSSYVPDSQILPPQSWRGKVPYSICPTPASSLPKHSRKHKMVLFFSHKNKAPVYWSGGLWTLSWRHCFFGNV